VRRPQWRNMSGRYRQVFIAGKAGPVSPELRPPPGAVHANASRAPELVPKQGGKSANKSVAAAIVESAEKVRSIRGGRKSMEKKFRRDDPRVPAEGGFSIPGSSALSVTAALGLPLLLAACRLTVSSPRFPLPPPARSLSAHFTAIACQRMLRPVDPSAVLQQTDPASRTMGSTLTPCSSERSTTLIFGRS
jgi:hypothetical protein